MKQMRTAFTLVELAVVLVIIGLLAGSIVAGRTLVQSSTLQKNVKWHLAMQSEFSAFRDKYQAFPGDMPNATTFWGRSSVAAMNCATQPGTASGTGTCNGDGDGYISFSATMPNESALVIHHLQLAGMDATPLLNGGSFPTAPTRFMIASGLNDIAYSFISGGAVADERSAVPPNGTMVTGIGLQTSSTCVGSVGGSVAGGGAILPSDAAYIDSKVDDGMPTTGIYLAANGVGVNTALGSCIATLQCLVASGTTYIYNGSNPIANRTLTPLTCRSIFLLAQ